MIPIDSIFRLLGAGLELWTEKERNKYVDAYLKLKQDYYDESNKERPDHAILDDIKYKLRLLCDSFSTSASKPNIKNS